MRKCIWFFFTLITTVGLASAQKATWDLSRDIQATGNQISFDQGAKGVWYFLESSSTVHDPLTYRLLGHYGAPCDANGKTGTFAVRALACWSSVDTDYTRGENRMPSVLFNFEGQTIYLNGYPDVGIPPKTVVFEGNLTKDAIIGWKSPISGTIRITGSVTDLHLGSPTGVLWSINRGRTMLSSQILPDGASQNFDLSDVTIQKDQVLYVIVDPYGDQDADEIAINLKIVQL